MRNFINYYIVIIFLFNIVSLSNIRAQDLYFMSKLYSSEKTLNHLDMINIYSFDYSSNNKLNLIHSIKCEADIISVRNYQSIRTLIVSSGLFFPSNIYIVPYDSVKKEINLSLKEYKSVSNYRVLSDNNQNTNLMLEVYDAVQKQVSSKILPLNLKQSASKSLSASLSNLTIAGTGSSYSDSKYDIIICEIDDSGKITTKNNEIDLNEIVVPSNIIKTKKTYSWLIIFNDIKNVVLMPTHKERLENREILLYNKISDKWSSVQVDGSATNPRPINNWLVGEIRYYHSDDDYEKRIGHPPIFSEDVFLLNLETLEYFRMYLGEKCELLWIDENLDIYFRLGDELYRAKFDNNRVLNRELIVKEDFVNYIHWAFRGSTGE